MILNNTNCKKVDVRGLRTGPRDQATGVFFLYIHRFFTTKKIDFLIADPS